MKRYIYAIMAFLALGMASCTTTKGLLKQATAFEQNGLIADAAEYYLQAVNKKPTNVDAKLGLVRCGQQVIDKKIAMFEEVYKSGNNEKSVELFNDIERYRSRVLRTGTELYVSAESREMYEDAKNVVINQKYAEGNEQLKAGNFKEAEAAFREVVSLKKNFKDTQSKLQIAVCEPYYRTATSQFDGGHYRSAYRTIEKMQSQYATYKDIIEIKSACLAYGRLHVVIPPVKSNWLNRTKAENVRNALTQYISEIPSPFITIYSNIDNLPQEGQVVVLDFALNSYNYYKSDLYDEEARGWLRRKEKKGDETVTVYDKAIYHICSQNCSLSFKIVGNMYDASTGNQLYNRKFTLTSNDGIRYAWFDGNPKNLVKGHWRKTRDMDKQEEYVEDNSRANRELAELFDSRRILLSQEELLDGMMGEVSAPFIDIIVNILNND